MFHRSRRRLAYWFTLSMGSILILFAFTIYYLQLKDRIRAFDETLYAQTKRINAKTDYELEKGRWQINAEKISLQEGDAPPLEIETEIAYIRWYDARGQLVQFIGTAAPKKLSSAPGYQSLKGNNNEVSDQQWLRQLTLPIKQDETAIAYLQVAACLSPIQENLKQTRLFLSLGVPLTLGLTGLVGWILGGLAMQPSRRAYEQLQRFTADASHELRAPVAAILSNAQVGLLAPVEDSLQQRQRLGKIVQTTKSMSSLIDNLLFLARHEGRLNPQDLKEIDLVDLLKSSVDRYQTLAAERNLNLIADLPLEPLKLNADSALLSQAVKNLLDNACKYTSSGGTVQLKLLTKVRRVFIEVEDNGIGIPQADLPHIFKRFYRVDEARSRQTGGFGLGLAIAQQIIEAHGGQIAVESTLGKGTKFQICLPVG
ncbi:two-component sensor histidine kinase [Hydrococcus rivularis NIES-593]|uniref:histidine kinase n=1 Tax=Hydrococcus rivularis NIES-593 TaxID=1921803 RepID=A0A1U7H972_9CYAN|nr:HAMP domain-containing sensor histidine kinase [Hydrococcus rivularis]OKH20147.1 two-component sensor histidine kinase [Hydrococcus rivularis NIES-593]